MFTTRRWVEISLFNLMMVAFLGLVLRYKIAFSLPFIDQKYLLHAHSHFAFSGWLSQILMALMVAYLSKVSENHISKAYHRLMMANLITAYGMLLSFAIQGYGWVSILFSTLSVFVSYCFAFLFWRDLNRLGKPDTTHAWFKTALVFNALSSLGAFSLAFLMATKNTHQEWYLACIYFFLHFQYNGWFFFACMGLLSHFLRQLQVAEESLRDMYTLFALACPPAYLLSALWLPIPLWAYILVVIAVFFQLAGGIITWRCVIQVWKPLCKTIGTAASRLLLMSGIALAFKLLLQAGSVIPSLSQLAFGFRPIVIGYLHLVLLGVITLFLLSHLLGSQIIHPNPRIQKGLLLFTIGILLNEFLLMLQGVADIRYINIPFINEGLFVIALILFSGMLLVNYGLFFSRKKTSFTQ